MEAKTALANHLANKMKVSIARGLRFNNVKHASNYGMAQSIEEYGRVAFVIKMAAEMYNKA
ncbi:hypothetical protein GQX74_009585 [Glossina fuscipes]|nr:hypothetical protein GQX74_009585 [Glossina fuscipes]